MTPRIWMNAMVAIFGMTASTAHATQTFCVDSVNQFDVAYAAADEENVIIQVVRGTYDMTGSHVDADSALEIDDDPRRLRARLRFANHVRGGHRVHAAWRRLAHRLERRTHRGQRRRRP